MAKGISGTGQGFDLPGIRLGGFSHQPPLLPLRQAALAAAESRARCGVLLPSGPQRLGGDNSIKSALSPIQAAAMAAERRVNDDIWCGSKSANTRIHENTCSIGPSGRQGMSWNSDDRSIQSTMGRETADDGAKWQCNTCTLLNEPIALQCEACGTQRQNNIAKSRMWSCIFCTVENKVDINRCLACGQWRYSYGPPVSTRGPYVGT